MKILIIGGVANGVSFIDLSKVHSELYECDKDEKLLFN